jgi:hypothetical protein
MRDMRRFWEKVDKTEQCWNWTASVSDTGYGTIKHPATGNCISVHRFVYEELVGEIPEGLTLDHLCRNRRCVNPAHLEAVTIQENIRRALPFRVRPSTCKHGHEFTPENTHIRNGLRICRACGRRRINVFRSKETQAA